MPEYLPRRALTYTGQWAHCAAVCKEATVSRVIDIAAQKSGLPDMAPFYSQMDIFGTLWLEFVGAL